ncbi:dual oxidase maturation factor 2 [Pelobates fuscus]|uniref:dual oxidase maturation factor 2 n=1 Tax=Pelobates fuscus TaxID=191477 RepID=UPI002FE4DE71
MAFYNGIYPFYPQDRMPFVFNMQSVVVIIVFLILALAFILIVLGIRGKARIFWTCRILTSLFIGAVTVAVNFTADWEVGVVNATTTYKSFSNAVVNADIGVYVGLKGINVTLKGNPIHQINETINYNEQFIWSFGQDFNEYYQEGLKKGLPNPILYIAEKFSHYNPCGLFAQYRLSAHYAGACMWVAFCSWVISNILFSFSVFIYGAYMILVTASFFIFSLLSFSTVRNVGFCDIKFGAESLTTYYGGSFWLTLATGLLCFVIGFTLIAMNVFIPEKLKIFFDSSEGEEEDYDSAEIYINNNCSHVPNSNIV